MTNEVIEVSDLDLERRGSNWPEGLATKVTTLLDQSLPYQHENGAFTAHSPEGGAVLIKLIRKESSGAGAALRELAELAVDFDKVYDYAFAWKRGSVATFGEVPQLYALYALGKLRATARTGMDTAGLIKLRNDGNDHFEAENLLAINVAENGDLQSPEQRTYGDFDRMGAVIAENDKYLVAVSCSGFSQEEDHLEAMHIAGYVLVQLDRLEQDDAA